MTNVFQLDNLYLLFLIYLEKEDNLYLCKTLKQTYG